jgi:hypothetical protein
MAHDKSQVSKLRIFTDPNDPDAVLVLVDGSMPGTIPVIPTVAANKYWAYPSKANAPSASKRTTARL